MVALQACGQHHSGTAGASASCMDGRAALLLTEVRACNGNGVRELLASGVDGNSRDALSHDHQTALYAAVCLNSQEIVFLLLHYGADVNGATSWGNRPIHAAADLGFEGVVTLLLKHNDSRGRVLEVNARNKNGDTALHLAAARGHLRICKSLLSHKADPWALNNRGRTARDEASSNGKSTVFQELYRHRHNDEDHEARNPSTAPIQRKHHMTSKGELITEPVRVRRRSRPREPVESDDTSIGTAFDSSISLSTDSSSSSSYCSSSSITTSSSPSSRSSNNSSPSTSIALSVCVSSGQQDLTTPDVLPECFESETSQKQPWRTESGNTESARKESFRRTNSCQPTTDSYHLEANRQLTNVRRPISAQDSLENDSSDCYIKGPPVSCSEPQNNTAFAAYFEEIQLALVRKEEQLRALNVKTEILAKKLAEKEEENALLRALLKGRTGH